MRSRLIGLSNGDEAGQMTDSLTIPGPYRWPGSVVDNIGGGTFVLTFDERGREVYNGLSGRLVSYNVLELPCYVDVLGETVKYSYLSDGSKCGMMDDALVRGFEYVGPFTYWIDGDDVCLYSVGMSCGRFVKSPDSQGLVPEYWSMDYLGSVRAKSRPGGTEHIDYFPYGQCMKGVASQYDENGYGFNGKELQGFHSVDLYDYGARMYDPGLSFWNTPEPLFEKNHMVHALSFCNGDPVNYVDPDGNDPIFDEYGNLIGVTDSGLQGDAIIVKKSEYNPNLTIEQIMSLNHGLAGLIDDEAFDNFNRNFDVLSMRPDWDGYLTLEEANDWFRAGNGQMLYVDLRKINLQGIVSLGEKYVGQKKCFNLLTCSSIKDGLVYGNITLKRYPNHGVRAFEDEYDFDMKNWFNPINWGRNLETVIGAKYAGDGTSYSIRFYGTAKLKPIFPWVK